MEFTENIINTSWAILFSSTCLNSYLAKKTSLTKTAEEPLGVENRGVKTWK